jgi:prolyl-tRNA synthetase
MLRDDDGDAAIIDYCKSLAAELRAESAFGEPLRVLLDLKANKPATKRWGWVKKGAPLILEIGGRDVAGGNVSVLRRDRLYTAEGKLASAMMARGDFVGGAGAQIEDIEASLFAEAKARLVANVARDVTNLATHFKGSEDKFVGWVEVQWSRPTGAALDEIVKQLKALKITMRNTPLGGAPVEGACFFTGEEAVERILIGRTY